MPNTSTARRFLRSTAAAALSQGWRVGMTLVAMMALRRLVDKDDWGLYTWAWVLFLILGAARDLGLIYHVLRIEPRPYGNLLRLELSWGPLVTLAAFFGAPWLAGLSAEPHPQIVPVLRAMSLLVLAEGLAAVPKTWFEGELQVGRTVLPEVLRNLVFVLLSVTLAWRGWGVWSMVLGQLAGTSLYAVLLWRRAWGRIPLVHLPGQTWPLVRASLPLALIWFLAILSRHIDPLVLGRRFDFSVIGEYTFAYEWATMVAVQVLLPAVLRTLYPALRLYAEQPRQMFHAFALTVKLMLALEVIAALVVFVNAELVVLVVAGQHWMEHAPGWLRILCLAPLVDPFGRLGGELLKAMHLDRRWMASALLTVLTFAVGGYWLTGQVGAVGMAWVNLLALGGLLMGWNLYRISPMDMRALLADLPWIYLLPLPPFVAIWWLGEIHPWLRLGLSALAAVFGLGAIWWRFGGEFKAFLQHGLSESQTS